MYFQIKLIYQNPITSKLVLFLFPCRRCNYFKIDNAIYQIGRLKTVVLAACQKSALRDILHEAIGLVSMFSRCWIKGQIIHSKSYTKVTKRNSYTVKYEDDGPKYGQVDMFIQHQSRCFAPPLQTTMPLPQTFILCSCELFANTTESTSLLSRK